jgi:transglutaminase-like putative cysteine protease
MTEFRRSFPIPQESQAILIDEHRAKQRLERLESTTSLSAEKQQLADGLVENVRGAAASVEQRILDRLIADDPTTREFVHNTHRIADSLQTLADNIRSFTQVPQELVDASAEFLPLFDETEKQLWETIIHAEYTNDVASASRELSNTLKNPQHLWMMVVKQGWLPEKMLGQTEEDGALVTCVDEVAFFFELQQLLTVLDEESALIRDKKERKAFRFYTLKNLCENRTHILSPAIFEDLVEHRYDHSDPWIQNSIFSSFEELQEMVEKNERSLSPNQKRLLAGAIGVMIAVAVTMAGGEQLGSTVRTTYENLHRTEQVDEQENQEQEDSQTQNQDNETTEDEENTKELAPENDDWMSPENSGEFPDGFSWKIEGDIPNGYFRDSTATVFYTNPTWKRDYSSSSQYLRPPREAPADMVLQSEVYFQGNTSYSIPVPGEGYVPSFIDAGEGVEANVYFGSNGTYSFLLNNVSKPVQVRIGWVRADRQTTDIPQEKHLEHEALVDSIEDLPQEAQQVLKEVEGLSNAQKAERITNFVKNYFTYSLDPSHNAYHQRVANKGEFVRRLFTRPFGDCDVINTVNVAMLRLAGVPSRMAYGYMNGSSILDATRNQLDNGERHGWAEYWDGTKWVTADATPSRVDQYTFDRLNDRGISLDFSQLLNPDTWSQMPEMIRWSMLSLLDDLRDYGFSTGLFVGAATYLTSWAYLSVARSKQQRRIDAVRQDIKNLRPPYQSSEIERRFLWNKTNNLNLQNWSEQNGTSGPIYFAKLVAEFFALVPVIRNNRERGRRLQEAETRLANVNRDYARDHYAFFPLVQELFDETPEQVTKQFINENLAQNLSLFPSRGADRIGKKAATEFGFYFGIKLEGKTNERQLLLKTLKESKNEEDFLNTIVDKYYAGYLEEAQKAAKERARNARRAAKSRRGGRFIEDTQPMAAVHVLLSKEDFVHTFADEFVIFDRWHELYKHSQNILKNRTAEAKAHQTNEQENTASQN